MCLQRVAWFCCAAVILGYVVIGSRNKIRTLIIGLIVALILVYLMVTNETINHVIRWRLEGSENIFAERNSSWFKVFEQEPLQIIFGNGVGLSGHRGIGTGALGIHDGSYFKLLYEVGIVGLLPFMIVIIYAYYCGSKKVFRLKKREYLLYLAIISVICVHAIGSNVFTFQLMMPIFWLSIGKCIKGETIYEDFSILSTAVS